jgi:hypothetical protein
MGRYQANLPAVLNPVGDICVEVTIPAHPDYVKLFVRAVRMLETNRMYARDDEFGAKVKIITDNWRDRTVTPLIEALATGTGMCGVDGECLAYPPFASFISYYPQNPYTEPDLVPPDFLAPPFFVNGKDAAHDLPNYEKGDIIVNFAAINLEPVWNLDNTPRIELCLEGSGVVELHLLKTVQGGAAVVSVDNPVDLGDIISGVIGDGIEIISLNQDIISLPPETAEEVIIEQEITTEGEHTLYIYFLPTLDDSLIPLFFGGGLREISLCGNIRPCGTPAPEPPPPLEGVTELKPEFQFTADCGLELRYRNQDNEIISDWEPVSGWTENFADCVLGANSMATKEDIRDGMYEAFNRLAAQVVSGRYLNISVDEDGNVSNPETDGEDAGLPEDDPATPAIDETLSAKAGGAIQVRIGFNDIWSKINAWYIASMPQAQVADRLVNLYKMNDLIRTQLFVDDYYTTRDGGGSVVSSFPATLDNYTFCKGATSQSVFEWIYENQAVLLINNSVLLVEAVSQEQLSDWFAAGTEIPSTTYNIYPCTKVKQEILNFDFSLSNAPQLTTVETWKGGHRFLIKLTGTYTDSDNVQDTIYDGMYEHNLVTGVKTFIPFGFNSAGGIPAVTQAQVPFEPSHIYEFTVDKGLVANGTCIITGNNGSAAIPNVTGIVQMTITDLGEFAI